MNENKNDYLSSSATSNDKTKKVSSLPENVVNILEAGIRNGVKEGYLDLGSK